VHRRGIEGVLARADPEKARGLFEGLGSDPGHVLQLLAAREGTVGVAVGDDVFCQPGGQAGDARQQRHGGHVHVDTHRVHAILDYGVQLLRQFHLADIVLVLAHADGLGIDLHQFGERVLQAPCDRHCAADAHIDIRKFLRRELGG